MYPAYIPENMYYTVMEYVVYAGDKSHIWGCHSTYREDNYRRNELVQKNVI